MTNAGGGSRLWWSWWAGGADWSCCLTANDGGAFHSLFQRLWRATTVQAALGGLRSFAGGAVGTSGGQQASTQPRGTSVIVLLALVVLGGGWRLVGPWPVSPAIGDAVRVVVAVE